MAYVVVFYTYPSCCHSPTPERPVREATIAPVNDAGTLHVHVADWRSVRAAARNQHPLATKKHRCLRLLLRVIALAAAVQRLLQIWRLGCSCAPLQHIAQPAAHAPGCGVLYHLLSGRHLHHAQLSLAGWSTRRCHRHLQTAASGLSSATAQIVRSQMASMQMLPNRRVQVAPQAVSSGEHGAGSWAFSTASTWLERQMGRSWKAAHLRLAAAPPSPSAAPARTPGRKQARPSARTCTGWQSGCEASTSRASTHDVKQLLGDLMLDM